MNRILALVLGLILVFPLAAPIFAQSSNAQIPEKNGDYQDPDHPGVRVRVFIHEPKERTISANSVCSEDLGSNAVVGATGWKLPSTNWYYKLNTSSVPSSVGGGNLATIAANGFNAWTGSISSPLLPNISYGGTTTKSKSAYDGQNIISWGRTSGNALAVTYTRYYTLTRLVVDVDTIMNLKFPWTLNTCSANAYDAANILTHELGHWFGLNDEYTPSYINNTMYGYGSKAETKKNTLTTGDIQGLQAIYP